MTSTHCVVETLPSFVPYTHYFIMWSQYFILNAGALKMCQNIETITNIVLIERK